MERIAHCRHMKSSYCQVPYYEKRARCPSFPHFRFVALCDVLWRPRSPLILDQPGVRLFDVWATTLFSECPRNRLAMGDSRETSLSQVFVSRTGRHGTKREFPVGLDERKSARWQDRVRRALAAFNWLAGPKLAVRYAEVLRKPLTLAASSRLRKSASNFAR